MQNPAASCSASDLLQRNKMSVERAKEDILRPCCALSLRHGSDCGSPAPACWEGDNFVLTVVKGLCNFSPILPRLLQRTRKRFLHPLLHLWGRCTTTLPSHFILLGKGNENCCPPFLFRTANPSFTTNGAGLHSTNTYPPRLCSGHHECSAMIRW